MSPNKPSIYSTLYLVVDPSLYTWPVLSELILNAVSGGVDVVQLRDKNASAQKILYAAKFLIDLLHPFNVPLIINDRVDICYTAQAQGVHLGQEDIPPKAAREILGPHAIIGLSIEHPSQLDHTPTQHIDYLAASPVFQSRTKLTRNPPLGLAGLAKIKAATTLPIVAIGGINLTNAHSIIHAGADSLSVVSAITQSSNPKLSAYSLKQKINHSLSQ